MPNWYRAPFENSIFPRPNLFIIFSLFYKQLVNLLINKEKLLFKGPFPKAWASELSEVNKTNSILFLYRTNIDYSSDCQSIILMTM